MSADIEGVTGIAHWDEAEKPKADHAWFADRMNTEVAAVCRAAIAAGHTVTVKDAHATGRNLLPDRLPAPTALIRGWSGHPYGMVQEIDGGFDALAVVGYHSPATSGGNALSHTLTGRFSRVRIDGERASELLLSAMTARCHDVPTVFVSGDAGICEEACARLPGVVTVPTGRGIGHSMVARHPDVVLSELADGIVEALARPLQRVTAPEGPHRLEVRFRVHHEAYRASHFPGASLVSDDTVALVAPTWMALLRALLFW